LHVRARTVSSLLFPFLFILSAINNKIIKLISVTKEVCSKNRRRKEMKEKEKKENQTFFKVQKRDMYLLGRRGYF
jgi:hypothetical protein